MFNIMCTICGEDIKVDYDTTLSEYLTKVDYVKDDINKTCDIAISSFLVYKCLGCNKTFKYTLKEVEFMIRQTITKDIKRYRKSQVSKQLYQLTLVDPDNGMDYCGLCDGVDGEGNCFVDMFPQCPFRR